MLEDILPEDQPDRPEKGVLKRGTLYRGELHRGDLIQGELDTAREIYRKPDYE
jgi:hypothetical protein